MTSRSADARPPGDPGRDINKRQGRGAREEALRDEPSRFRRFLKLLGPGLIAGASDDDPSGVGTCTSIGAASGFATLWTMLLGIPLMASVQYISAKVGLVTGRGLAGVIRRHYGRGLLYPVVAGLIIVNTINAGADLGAVAASINLLCPRIPIPALILPVTVVILVVQVWGSYRLIERTFKWLTLALLGYIGAGILARPDWGEVVRHTFIPTIRWDRDFLMQLVAISGASFSPYLYFWQASQEVEEKLAIGLGRKKLWQLRGTTDAELTYAAWDVNLGMTASNLVTYFIILATGATLYPAGIRDVDSATQAASALEPFAGRWAEVLFALGMIGAGCLAVPVLTASAAYAFSEAFGWSFGLDKNPGRAPQFYGVILASTLVATEMNYLDINPMNALYWTSVLNGVLTPPLLLLMMLISSNPKIMGARVNRPLVNFLGWLAVLATTATVVGMVVTWGK